MLCSLETHRRTSEALMDLYRITQLHSPEYNTFYNLHFFYELKLRIKEEKLREFHK